ncbi:hypothetical protein F5880DRAFT_1619106 [Lentinula raphanica]|nr:hypothetical protein F5880DRAFT_1619106 [Lentinula raphanica]
MCVGGMSEDDEFTLKKKKSKGTLPTRIRSGNHFPTVSKTHNTLFTDSLSQQDSARRNRKVKLGQFGGTPLLDERPPRSRIEVLWTWGRRLPPYLSPSMDLYMVFAVGWIAGYGFSGPFRRQRAGNGRNVKRETLNAAQPLFYVLDYWICLKQASIHGMDSDADSLYGSERSSEVGVWIQLVPRGLQIIALSASSMAKRPTAKLRVLYRFRRSRPTSRADGPGYLYAFLDNGLYWKSRLRGGEGQKRWHTFSSKTSASIGPESTVLDAAKFTMKSLYSMWVGRLRKRRSSIRCWLWPDGCEGMG